jgi:hypothetical protein
MKSPKEILVPIAAHAFAIEKARTFCKVARTMSTSIGRDMTDPEMLTYRVNASFAIELYLKTLMVSARGGRVTRGHSLMQLYAGFPAFLKDCIEHHYITQRPEAGWQITMRALTFRSSPPPVPSSSHAPQYASFQQLVATLNNAFECSRYFYERVNDSDWQIYDYAPGPIEAAMTALDATYEFHRTGGFAPKT